MRIAVLGMGRMGHAVAARLLDGGQDVTVWNRSPGRADDLVSKGAAEAPSAAEAARGQELVITSLTDDAAVLAVVVGDEGDGGVAKALEPHAIYADMSTVSPETAARLADATGERNLASPILGGPAVVENGTATYLVSGPKERFEAAKPVYDVLGDSIRYLGEDVRLALQLKLVANYLLLSGIVVLGEAIATAQAVGVGEELLRGFLGGSPLVAPGLENRLDALIDGKHDGWFTTPLGAKDVGLLEELGRREGLRLPLADLVKRRYEEAAASGHADEDLTAVIELLRDQR
jgi:3-hydroxyisobutyrate dehydrogenase-like beta-hydroxyacid dehydrogenase